MTRIAFRTDFPASRGGESDASPYPLRIRVRKASSDIPLLGLVEGMHEGKERPRSNPPLHSERLELKRKLFFLDLYENDHGRFIKITEDVKGRRDTILVPMEILPEFRDALATIAEVDETVA